MQEVVSIEEAVKINLESMDGVKVFGISVGADWDHENSVYYAECIIGDGSELATVRIEEKAWKGSPEKGSEFEMLCYDLGEELGAWLQQEFGEDYEYGVELN